MANLGKVPRIVFASLKGGVGRSTALCVVAAHLSRRGQRVLTIDFDLEAPGIGSMLLDEQELPEYGLLDYLVEAGLSNADDGFIAGLIGDSFLGSGGARVSVIPAIGRRTLEHPENALAKLARAYLDVPQESGAPRTITDQLSDLLARYDAFDAYDVVLIDGRSGLHETTASLILGIGAEVLLFGLDQPQTYQGYRLLMGQLIQYQSGTLDDSQDRITFVHAKASDSLEARSEVASKFQMLLSPSAYLSHVEALPTEQLTENDFELDWQDTSDLPDDEAEETQVLYVLEDTRYRQFDPILDRKILDARSYAATFSSLLEFIDSIVMDPLSDELEDQSL
ncbi:ParA family protein [Bradyrhizobium liaoningense]